jgi:hypothetical protein
MEKRGRKEEINKNTRRLKLTKVKKEEQCKFKMRKTHCSVTA